MIHILTPKKETKSQPKVSGPFLALKNELGHRGRDAGKIAKVNQESLLKESSAQDTRPKKKKTINK